MLVLLTETLIVHLHHVGLAFLSEKEKLFSEHLGAILVHGACLREDLVPSTRTAGHWSLGISMNIWKQSNSEITCQLLM